MRKLNLHDYLNPSLHGIARLAVAAILGALFWPAICEISRGFGDPGAFHDAMLVTAVIAGGTGGIVGLLVGLASNPLGERVSRASSGKNTTATGRVG